MIGEYKREERIDQELARFAGVALNTTNPDVFAECVRKIIRLRIDRQMGMTHSDACQIKRYGRGYSAEARQRAKDFAPALVAEIERVALLSDDEIRAELEALAAPVAVDRAA